jgi:hypothetical protein
VAALDAGGDHSSGRGHPPPARGWLFGPGFDALFIANLAWPLIALTQFGDSFTGRAGLQFWQLYFITTPHRWITLVIVFADRDRFRQRRGIFIGLAVAFTALALGLRLGTGALTCLLAIDYVWNAWHFASQHHGIYRIYDRLAGTVPPAGTAAEKWILRGFLLYVTLRVATSTWPDAAWDNAFAILDWIAVAVPVWLLAREFARPGASWQGRRLYLLSVLALYVSLLWAVHEHLLGLVLTLATTSALFHAIEYLAIVTWSVRQRHASMADRLGLLSYFAPRWGIVLAVFGIILGAGGWLLDQEYLDEWLFINVIVAFLHYSYDGLIWRRR